MRKKRERRQKKLLNYINNNNNNNEQDDDEDEGERKAEEEEEEAGDMCVCDYIYEGTNIKEKYDLLFYQHNLTIILFSDSNPLLYLFCGLNFVSLIYLMRKSFKLLGLCALHHFHFFRHDNNLLSSMWINLIRNGELLLTAL